MVLHVNHKSMPTS
ncbi:hypothetical protein F383_24571 [Gossypium arboreum]|nr:hypothetical protein F383_24571 [Gossypium arboreum]